MEKEEKTKVYIYQCKLSKRFLCFLSDLFLTLILGVLIFEGICLQIGKPIMNYDSKAKEIDEYSNARMDLFYNNNILFFDDDNKYDFSENIGYTSNLYTKKIVLNTNDEHDVFNNYFINYKKISNKELTSLVFEYGSDYFEENNDSYVLKSQYIEEFKPKFVTGDEMSEDASTHYDNYIKHFFLPFYDYMTSDIKENDLTFNGVSFLKLSNTIDSLNSSINNLYVYSAIVAYLLSVTILSFVIPFIDKKGRTISQMILKIERIDKNKIQYLKRGFLGTIYLFDIFGFLPILMFIPIMSLSFSSLFTLTYLWVPSLIGLTYVLIDLFVMIFNKMNRSFKELLTNSIVVESSVIDEYYQRIGYGG